MFDNGTQTCLCTWFWEDTSTEKGKSKADKTKVKKQTAVERAEAGLEARRAYYRKRGVVW